MSGSTHKMDHSLGYQLLLVEILRMCEGMGYVVIQSFIFILILFYAHTPSLLSYHSQSTSLHVSSKLCATYIHEYN